MPKPYKTDRRVRFYAQELGMTPSGVLTGTKHSRVVNGQSFDRNTDSPLTRRIPRPYSGLMIRHQVTRAFSPPVSYTSRYDPSGIGDGLLGPLTSPTWYNDHQAQILRNKSWERLVSNIRTQESSLGTTLAEGREALAQIFQRASQLRGAYSNLKRGNFKQFLRYLSVDPKRAHRNWRRTAAKEASGLWLEYWFGWAPLVSDLWNSSLVFAAPPQQNWSRAKGSARSRVPFSNVAKSYPATLIRGVDMDLEWICSQQCEFRVINENLALANKFGFLNPLSIAWELVPFSFVADWFTDFGSFVGGWTDLCGYEIRAPQTVYYVSAKGTWWSGAVSNQLRTNIQGYQCKRFTSLSSPVVLKPRFGNFGDSFTRAATAVSLLTQLFIED